MSSPLPDRTPPSHLPQGEERAFSEDSAREEELLQAVLRRTMAMEQDGNDGARLRGAVEAVVRRYRGQPLEAEPAVSNLVEVVLQEEFRDRPNWAVLWPGLARRIAGILWEDPTARSRLEALWAHLSGV